jgi:hypothetical protein
MGDDEKFLFQNNMPLFKVLSDLKLVGEDSARYSIDLMDLQICHT